MSVFTHGVTSKDKPRMVNGNQVFPVAGPNKGLREESVLGRGATLRRCPAAGLSFSGYLGHIVV